MKASANCGMAMPSSAGRGRSAGSALRSVIGLKRVWLTGARRSPKRTLEGGAETLLTKPIDFVLLRNEIDGRIARAA